MAKKKRRGRPPGSKNRAKANKSIAIMDVVQLSDHIAGLRKTLAAKIQQQRQALERQLAGLSVYSDGMGSRRKVSARASNPRSGTRRKPKPKYQSKKNPRLKWTGRGITPVWMRDEMKGTNLKKDNFLIKS